MVTDRVRKAVNNFFELMVKSIAMSILHEKSIGSIITNLLPISVVKSVAYPFTDISRIN